VILVGPARAELAELADSLSGGLTVVREDPPGSGPVPALRTGLREARAPWVAVLAADLPFLRGEHVRDLLTVASRQTPGAEPPVGLGTPADLGTLARAEPPDGHAASAGGGPSADLGTPTRAASPVGLGAPVRAEPPAGVGSAAGVVMADDGGCPQWLAGCWPTARLTAALLAYRGSSLRGLLGPLRPALLTFPASAGLPPPWLDCDTPAELAAARGWPLSPPDGPAERQPCADA
jgi:molybdopterin-guanine dinucleotide biosynthesis protein A